MTDDQAKENGVEEESFADLFESYSNGMNEDVRVGDRIRGEVISIGKDTVFVDTGTKIDGVVERDELKDEKGDLTCKVGDFLDLYVVSYNGNEIRLSRALSGAGGLNLIKDAFEKAVPVEGKVKSPCKGGFHVEIMQRRVFCPISQMDLRFVEHAEEYVGKTFPFLITQFEEGGKNIVVSRRALLNRELQEARKAFYKDLEIGAELEGTVTKLMPYGVFVELFPGVEGMVHISELSWSRVEKPDELFKAGDAVKASVIGIEKGDRPDRVKIALSVKQTTEDPWKNVAESVHEGDKVNGRVTRCTRYGAFVEIAPGIEGLVHISEMSYKKRVIKPEEIVEVGQTVAVVVKEVDPLRKRVSLSIKDAEGDPWIHLEEKYSVGQSLEGTLEKKEHFGYFISLEPGITGLLPKSKIGESAKSSALEKLREGEPVTVVIEAMSPGERRITLGPGDKVHEEDWQHFVKGAEKPVSSLGQKLQEALRSEKDKLNSN